MPPESKKLLDQVRETIRLKHYSKKTEKSILRGDAISLLFLYRGMKGRVTMLPGSGVPALQEHLRRDDPLL